MTLVREARRVNPTGTHGFPYRPRLIVVGVRNAADDVSVLRWAAAEALPQDSLHVVRAYVPMGLTDCHWDPVRRSRDARLLAARRLTSQAVQRLRAMRVDIAVAGSAVAGLPEDVLVEFSEVVDLIVIGDDGAPPAHAREVARQVQKHACCPVVSVPAAASRFDAAVSVLIDERGLRPGALRFAIDWAQRHDVNVQVSRTWRSLHESAPTSPTWQAHQLEELDAQLAEWQRRYPKVGIVARLELGDDWMSRLSAQSSLFVVAAGSEAVLRPESGLRCPGVVVPG